MSEHIGASRPVQLPKPLQIFYPASIQLGGLNEPKHNLALSSEENHSPGGLGIRVIRRLAALVDRAHRVSNTGPFVQTFLLFR